MIIGLLDANGGVRFLAGDVESVMGYRPSECIGTQALTYVHNEDRGLIRGGRAGTESVDLRLHHQSGEWFRAGVVVAPVHPADSGLFAFVITAPRTGPEADLADRVALLETSMRRIAAEVAATGMGGSAASAGALHQDDAEVLSPRQTEIAERLAAGKRVPTIARETGLSQSTVRNHLSQIFRKFGVASQAELIEALQRGPGQNMT